MGKLISVTMVDSPEQWSYNPLLYISRLDTKKNLASIRAREKRLRAQEGERIMNETRQLVESGERDVGID